MQPMSHAHPDPHTVVMGEAVDLASLGAVCCHSALEPWRTLPPTINT